MEHCTKRKMQAYQTKQNLFRCALRLFAQKPYEDVTVNDICNEAQVSVGAFYHHFKNKENILNEGYRLFDEVLEEKWANGHPDDDLDVIYFLFDTQIESMIDMGPLAGAQYFKTQLTTDEKYILNQERFFNRTLASAVENEVSCGKLVGDACVIAEDILSVSRGIIYDWCLHGGGYDLTDKSKRCIAMVLNYYTPGKA